MKSIPVSVVIITKDEERAISRCVDSLAEFNEIFVVDSHSSDRTAELATQSGAKVVNFTWNGEYPKKKQWALENLPLSNDWVLYLDGDEYITPEFAREVCQVVSSPAHAAYDVPLDYVFLGRPLEHGYKVRKRVLFDRQRCGWEPLDDLSVDKPFEMELHVQPTVRGTTGLMTTSVVHDDLEPLGHYFDRHNRYSDWEAVLRQNRDRSESVERTARGKIFARIPFKSFAFFSYSYLAKQGFRDGRAGFHYALANSFYYWQIGLKTRQLSDQASENLRSENRSDAAASADPY